MVLGAITCPYENVPEVHKRIREIKAKHGLPNYQEIKWTKISPSNVSLYTDLIDYFFDDDDLRFRAVVCHKDGLDHAKHNGGCHDTWYYKMYYQLLQRLIDDRNTYSVYLDIKDTLSAEKSGKLQEVLCNSKHDYHRRFLKSVQPVRSHEVQILQLADVLIGALSYSNRQLSESGSKLAMIQRIKDRAKLALDKSNYSEKFNLFHWQGQGA